MLILQISDFELKTAAERQEGKANALNCFPDGFHTDWL